MKSFTALGLALTAAAAALAGPASAQSWQSNGHGGRHNQTYNSQVWQEIAELDRKIDRADWRNTISEREAAGLHRQVRDLKQDFRRLSANGLDRGEARRLTQRTEQIERLLRHERRDRYGDRS